MRTSLCCPISEVSANDLGLVGGKGANLGELAAAGFLVPAAFCVTTNAYQLFVMESDLKALIGDALSAIHDGDIADIQRASRIIQSAILEAPVPTGIQRAISAAYDELMQQTGSPQLHVSVRSSATAEDLPGASFAGQQDTYLHITGLESILVHVRRCWASLWNDRAISYRIKQGFDHLDVSLAVVIQEMFPSSTAGVIFTVNPVNSNQEQMYINSSWGLGEAVVSGTVEPDQYLVRRRDLKIESRVISRKQTMVVPDGCGQGSTHTQVPSNQQQQPALSDSQVSELARLALQIEQHYGYPQDIEWGFANGGFAILQSREITATDIDYREGLESWQSPEAFSELTSERWIWSRAYSDELQTGPSTPNMYTRAQPHRIRTRLHALRYLGIRNFAGYDVNNFDKMPMFRWYGARAYYNTHFEREWIRQLVPAFARDEIALSAFPADQRDEIRHMPFNWTRFLWRMLRLEIRHPSRSIRGSTRFLYNNFQAWIDHGKNVWESVDLKTASASKLLAVSRRANEGSQLEENVALPFNLYLYFLPHGLRELCRRWCSDENSQLFGKLMSGMRTPTGEQNAAVWELSRMVRESPELTALFQNTDNSRILAGLTESGETGNFREKLEDFIKNFGHRGAAERDLYYPRWRDQPENVFNPIKAMMPLSDEESPMAHEERLHQLMLEAKATCFERVRKLRFGLIKAAFFKWYLDLVQDYLYYRDWERFMNDKNKHYPRTALLTIGRQFTERGILEKESDIFFLAYSEIEPADRGELTARDALLRVRARREVYNRHTNREPPKFIRGWEAIDEQPLRQDSSLLKGVPASSGVAQGSARVCRKLEDIGRIQKGDILVTTATDPAWTTVFSIISGIVIEGGGVVSHAVMISREFGIPCVSSLADACNSIPDGQLIRIDGSKGIVQLTTPDNVKSSTHAY